MGVATLHARRPPGPAAPPRPATCAHPRPAHSAHTPQCPPAQPSTLLHCPAPPSKALRSPISPSLTCQPSLHPPARSHQHCPAPRAFARSSRTPHHSPRAPHATRARPAFVSHHRLAPLRSSLTLLTSTARAPSPRAFGLARAERTARPRAPQRPRPRRVRAAHIRTRTRSATLSAIAKKRRAQTRLRDTNTEITPNGLWPDTFLQHLYTIPRHIPPNAPRCVHTKYYTVTQGFNTITAPSGRPRWPDTFLINIISSYSFPFLRFRVRVSLPIRSDGRAPQCTSLLPAGPERARAVLSLSPIEGPHKGGEAVTLTHTTLRPLLANAEPGRIGGCQSLLPYHPLPTPRLARERGGG